MFIIERFGAQCGISFKCNIVQLTIYNKILAFFADVF